MRKKFKICLEDATYAVQGMQLLLLLKIFKSGFLLYVGMLQIYSASCTTLSITSNSVYDAIPDQIVTLRTTSLLLPSAQTQRRSLHIIDEGHYERETQLCMRSY